MKINYYFKNVDDEIKKNNVKVSKNDNLLIFKIDDDYFKIDIKNNILLKKNNESKLLLKFSKNKLEDGSYYIKELDSIFDTKIKTEMIDKKDKFHIKYKMWLDGELIGDFELKIEYKES